MQTHDSLGRRFPNQISAPDKKLQITRPRHQMLERVLWFVALPHSHLKAYLHHFGLINTKQKQATLVDLSSNSPTDNYLYRNSLQYPLNAGNYVPRNHHIIEELGVKGEKYLAKKNPRASAYWHELACSIFMAEIELATMETQTITFKPRHMAKNQVDNGYTVMVDDKKTMLFDDGLFILNYGNEDRYHFLEIDLGNEQQSAANGKKSIERMLRQWYAFLCRPKGGQRSQYGKLFDTQSRAVVHFVFNSEQRMKNAMELLMKITGKKGCSEIFFSTDTRFNKGGFLAPKVSLDNFSREYLRAGRPPIRVDQ